MNKNYKLDFVEIEKAALPNLESILRRWLPDGKIVGGEFIAKNPKRNDNKAGSFKINLHTGRWADFACSDAKGFSVISLAAYIFDLDSYQAASKLAEMLNIGGGNV